MKQLIKNTSCKNLKELTVNLYGSNDSDVTNHYETSHSYDFLDHQFTSIEVLCLELSLAAGNISATLIEQLQHLIKENLPNLKYLEIYASANDIKTLLTDRLLLQKLQYLVLKITDTHCNLDKYTVLHLPNLKHLKLINYSACRKN